MANIPPNDPSIDAPAIVPAPVNPDHAPAQPAGLGNGFAPHWIGDNIPNNQNEDEETPPTSPVIPDAHGQPIPPIALFGQNFHFGESSSTANL
nr:hypothetical protein [Tanacetum cinerariifolium]